jgi:hypothetical protein
MPKTSPLEETIQQLSSLSIEQLLEVRGKVDELIKEKSSPSSKITGSYSSKTFISPSKGEVDFLITIPALRDKAIDKARKLVLRAFSGKYPVAIKDTTDPLTGEHRFIATSVVDAIEPEELDRENVSLENLIRLVDEWVSDEPGYDEETYPQIEAALNRNRHRGNMCFELAASS